MLHEERKERKGKGGERRGERLEKGYCRRQDVDVCSVFISLALTLCTPEWREAKKNLLTKVLTNMASNPITILAARLACYMIILGDRSLLQSIQHIFFCRKVFNL